MTGETIALTSVFGSLGYLVIGWFTSVVCAARWHAYRSEVTHHGYDSSTVDRQPTPDRAHPGWFWFIVFWPFIFPALVFVALAFVTEHLYKGVARASLWSVRKLNPQITTWKEL